jgi:hypothetical protein
MSLSQYLVDKLLPEWAKGDIGVRVFGGAYGLPADLVADDTLTAATAGLLAYPTSPDDALPPAGTERGGLYRYPAESLDQFRARLIRAADDWAYAGAGSSIIGQLAAAGYPGATIVMRPDRVGPHAETAPFLSQYWIRFPIGSYPALLDPTWGDMTWGFFWWGIGALPRDFVELVLGIVDKFGDPCGAFMGVELEGYDAE